MKFMDLDGNLFTFVPNKKIPIYNWFYYKEGFSRDLVLNILKKEKPSAVFDPFCGSGTTLLGAKELGIKSTGMDVTPIAVFVSKVKTRNYNADELKEYSKKIFENKFVKMKIPKLTKWFSKYTLEDVVFFRKILNTIEDETIHDFFKLALINATMKCSYVFKDGSVLKVRRKNVPPLRLMYKRTIRKMIYDIKKLKLSKVVPNVMFGDARQFELDENVDTIITSPPYLNKIEYSKIYKIENELFFNESPRPPIRSFFGLREPRTFKVKEIVGDYDYNVLAYFQDMYDSLKNMHKILNDEGKVYMVVGDGMSGNEIVDVIGKIKDMSEKIGFNHEDTIIGNERIATTPTRRRVGKLREGMIILRKS